MLKNPNELANDLDLLESLEKATLRFVVQAIHEFRQEAAEIFQNEKDLAQDIGEDVTREALDRIGVSKVAQRLFGKMDYKRARYLFLPEFAIKQALFIDSKAEKNAEKVARIQTSQISMRVRQIRQDADVDAAGELPTVVTVNGEDLLTTTIFVKYHYDPEQDRILRSITIAAIPNGMLQARYNPTCQDGIWLAGPNAPTRGEPFRTRLSFEKLAGKAAWRVQTIQCQGPLVWQG